jgi:hypothetical protein
MLVEQNKTPYRALTDSTAVYEPIFAKYNVTRQQLQMSLLPYVDNKQKAAEFYEKVVLALEQTEKQYAEELAANERKRKQALGINDEYHLCR